MKYCKDGELHGRGRRIYEGGRKIRTERPKLAL